MSQATFIKNAFNGGELSPRAEGRSDIPAYNSGGRKIQNLIITQPGALTRRPGTRYVADALDTSQVGRLIPFTVSRSDSYMLEFADHEVRIFREGSLLFYSNISVQDIHVNTTADTIEFQGHGFYHGQKVEIKSATSPPSGIAVDDVRYICLPRAIRAEQWANSTWTSEAPHDLKVEMGPYRPFTDTPSGVAPVTEVWISTVPSSTTFTISFVQGGSAINQGFTETGFCSLNPTEKAITETFRLATDPTDLQGSTVNITTQGDFVIGPFDETEQVTVKIPYSSAELKDIDYFQSADTLFLLHPDHQPRLLKRFNTSHFVLTYMETEDGPYGGIAPLGDDVDVDINANQNDTSIGYVLEYEIDQVLFRGSDVGQWFRKQYAHIDDGLMWVVSRIERLNDTEERLAQPRDGFFVAPLAVSDTLAITSHGFVVEELVWVVEGDGTLPSPLKERTPYYVIDIGSNELQLAATQADAAGGTQIVLTGGTGIAHHLISGWFNTVTRLGATSTHNFKNNGDWIGLWTYGEFPEGVYKGGEYKVQVRDALSGTNAIELRTRDDQLLPITSVGHGLLIMSGGGENELVTKAMSRTWFTIANVNLDTRDRPPSGQNGSWHEPHDQWRIGAWGAFRGWPSTGTLFEQRQVLASNKEGPNRFWGSTSGDF